MKIPILFDHDSTKIIGEIDGNIIIFRPDAKVTSEMFFDALNAGVKILEDEWIDDKTRYIRKAEIKELSIYSVTGHTMTTLPDKELLRPDEVAFIDKREIDYGIWMPKILRDLLFHDANVKENP